MLTESQHETLRDRGVVHVPGMMGRSVVKPIRDQTLRALRRLNIWGNGKPLRGAPTALPPFQQVTKVSSQVALEGAHAEALNSALLPTVRPLLPSRPRVGPTQLLVSLPGQGPWITTGLPWHTDLAKSDRQTTGIQAFVLVDDVVPQGGGTLAIAGSHLLESDPRRKDVVRGFLRRTTELDAELTANGLDLVEMSGNAGDVYLMDMRILHTPSVNASRRLRLMATVRYFPE